MTTTSGAAECASPSSAPALPTAVLGAPVAPVPPSYDAKVAHQPYPHHVVSPEAAASARSSTSSRSGSNSSKQDPLHPRPTAPAQAPAPSYSSSASLTTADAASTSATTSLLQQLASQQEQQQQLLHLVPMLANLTNTIASTVNSASFISAGQLNDLSVALGDYQRSKVALKAERAKSSKLQSQHKCLLSTLSKTKQQLTAAAGEAAQAKAQLTESQGASAARLAEISGLEDKFHKMSAELVAKDKIARDLKVGLFSFATICCNKAFIARSTRSLHKAPLVHLLFLLCSLVPGQARSHCRRCRSKGQPEGSSHCRLEGHRCAAVEVDR